MVLTWEVIIYALLFHLSSISAFYQEGINIHKTKIELPIGVVQNYASFQIQKSGGNLFVMSVEAQKLFKLDLSGNVIHTIELVNQPHTIYTSTDFVILMRDRNIRFYDHNLNFIVSYGLLMNDESTRFITGRDYLSMIYYSERSRNLYRHNVPTHIGVPYEKKSLTTEHYNTTTISKVSIYPNSSDVPLTLSEFTHIIPRHPIYLQSGRYLPHLDGRSFTIDTLSNLIFLTEEASSEISVYSKNGELLRRFGQRGQSLERSDTVHYFYSSENLTSDSFNPTTRLERARKSPRYLRILRDPSSDFTFRTYLKPLGQFESEAQKETFLLNHYLQVYKGDSLVFDFRIPNMVPFAVENGILFLWERSEELYSNQFSIIEIRFQR